MTPDADTQIAAPYSRLRFAAGLLGRSWLWFLAACLFVSVLPFAFGWSSYVIVTGSMEPSISPGDVVVTSPTVDFDDIAGRVVSFEDGAREGHMLTHRVVAVNDDGTLVTKGDANPTPDSVPVTHDSVTGMGRLLIRFVGLPVVWVRTGNWIPLFLHVILLFGAVVATVLDYEPEPGRPSDDDRDGGEDGNDRRKVSVPAGSATALLVLVTAITLGAGQHGVSDAAFNATTRNNSDTWGVPNWSYTDAINARSPYLYWKLDETGTATTAADASGNGRTGTYNPNGSTTNFTRLTDGALVTDTPDRAVRLVSATACINTTSATAINAPQVFTIIAWFRAPSTYSQGGKLIGFERPQTGVLAPSNGAYDRHLYMDGQGRIWFGVYNNDHITLSSAAGLNNNQWHMAVGTQSAAGMRLYIDGVLVASNNNTVAETQSGWWRAGCGNLSGWGDHWNGSNNPGTDSATTQNRTFAADLDEVTVYTSSLTAADVSFLYWAR